ncbi:MAG: protein kinase, partial [Gemmatimonadota bacterium]|nr:protein kinase [Gemmatimonadota bacterium]
MIGQTVSHYRVLDKLGGGGMGVVYRAEDTRLGRHVALKFLPTELTSDPVARTRFVQEARAASALDHANICTIHDIDETSTGQLYIVMALYDGETLKSRLQHGPLKAREAMAAARQVAAGLDTAHGLGIVHRDIKPANLMYTRRGEVKILDFGVAKLLGQAGVTRTGSSVGTLAYMSPEQLEGRDDVGPRADLWALGVVLYEMLTGRRPFEGRSEAETAAAILAQEPSPLDPSGDELAAGLTSLVTDLLRKRPEDRPPSASAVIERLDALSSPSQTAHRPLYRSPVTWVGVAAAAVLIAASIILPARSRARLDAARAALPEVAALAQEGRFSEAFVAAVELEDVLSGDSALAAIIEEASDLLTIRTEPPGATVWLTTFRETAADGASTPWIADEPMGQTPLVAVRVPRGDHLLLIEAEGFERVERVVSSVLSRVEALKFGQPFDIVLDVELSPLGSIPSEMVAVPGGEYTLVSADAPPGATQSLDAFLIDRFETTNQDYLAFVRSGGYAEPSLWPPDMPPSALAEFVDRTGLPGPRNWSEQRFEASAARHPVSGVTWYEASAYCRWREKSLPTIFEWEKAARGGAFTHVEGVVLPWGLVAPRQSIEARANFGSTGPVDVDTHPFGMSPYGAYEMAGNVREFTANAAEGGYVAMGASWQDRPYQFASIATPPGLSSSPTLGFRCARRDVSAEAQGGTPLQLARISPTYAPVEEATYRTFLAHYRYDPIALEPETDGVLETDEWRVENVTFNGLESDRIRTYLYLPKSASPPYQTMVFVASSSAFFADPVDVQLEWL